MNWIVVSDEKEIALINQHRKEQAAAKALREKQANCKHDWSYRGEYRGRSGYVCYLCDSCKSED